MVVWMFCKWKITVKNKQNEKKKKNENPELPCESRRRRI